MIASLLDVINCDFQNFADKAKCHMLTKDSGAARARGRRIRSFGQKGIERSLEVGSHIVHVNVNRGDEWNGVLHCDSHP